LRFELDSEALRHKTGKRVSQSRNIHKL
jgi:hypothetical protein